jgi:hypothetical protein
MTPGTQNIVETFWQQTSVRHRDVWKLRRQGWRHPDFIVPDLPGVPLLPRHLAQSGEPPAVAYTYLRCAKHQEGCGETRRGGAVHFKMTDGKLAGSQFDCRQVLDIDRAIASASPYRQGGHSFVDLDQGIYYRPAGDRPQGDQQAAIAGADSAALLAHMCRWVRRGITTSHFVEWHATVGTYSNTWDTGSNTWDTGCSGLSNCPWFVCLRSTARGGGVAPMRRLQTALSP